MNKRKALGGRWQSLLDRREDPRGQELEELWERPHKWRHPAINFDAPYYIYKVAERKGPHAAEQQ
jgi:hypothetical protein